MTRSYTVPFEATTSGTLVTDFFNLAVPATTVVRLDGIELSTTATSLQQLEGSVRRFTATTTNGTGGASTTPTKSDPNGAAALSSCRTMDVTTVATTSGTATILRFFTVNSQVSYIYQPENPDTPIYLAPSQNLIIRLDVGASPAVSITGLLAFTEMA